jgi:hypothetical protein
LICGRLRQKHRWKKLICAHWLQPIFLLPKE